MLDLTIPKIEFYDERKNEFVEIGPYNLLMEHSLVSISKWESKWHKTFIGSNDDLSNEELKDYLRCMTITQNVNPIVYEYFPEESIRKVNDYIADPMTGTTFYDFVPEKTKNKKVSSEDIYSQMILLGIPFECQKWHLNRLLTLIKVCNIDRSDKKMSKAETMRAYRKLNAERRKKMNSKG